MRPVSPDDRTVSDADGVAALGALALHLAGARTVEALTRTVLDQGLALLGARGGALGLLDGSTLRFTTIPGDIPLDAPQPAAHSARTGDAVFLGDRDSALAAFPDLADLDGVGDVQALACLPLRAGTRVLGVLVAAWSDPRRFPPAEVELLTAFAAQCAQALERIEADAARARSERRLALLAAATAAVAASLDVTTALERLAGTLVPALGDWCVLYVGAGEDSRERFRSASAHAAPERRELLRRLERILPEHVGGPSALSAVLGGGSARLVPTVPPGHLEAAVDDPEVRRMLVDLGTASAVVAPLTARGHRVGVLLLLRGTPGRPYGPGDLADVADLAGRAGLAIENLQLYEREHESSVALQRALLTDPPRIDEGEIAVRYRPASQEAQVGGDWYDAFRQPDGATVLVIGDVIGHDRRAAAAMGQVRGLLRGIGYHSGAGPADLLRGLDAALRGLQVGAVATAIVARLEHGGPAGTRLCWSSAGHPPPVLLRADGGVELLQTAPELLLGIDPGAPRSDAVADLEPGATLLLYTDGLVEDRRSTLDAGLDRLRAALGAVGGLPLEELCDALLAQLSPGAAADDIALVALRLRD